MNSSTRHQVQRVRRDTRRRVLTVQRITRVTPGMLRIRFTSPELADFESAAPDDHVKVFVPPTSGEDRCMRDYTPRAFDRANQWLDLDFALHEAGPATRWAMNARVGDQLAVGGPRGSTIVPDDFDWYLFIADETGLPAIGRWLEGLRSGVPATTLVAVASEAERQSIETRAAWTPLWALRNGASLVDDPGLLRKSVESVGLPSGEGLIWIAGEAAIARTLRSYFVDERGHPAAWVRASGYWSRGGAAAHEHFAGGDGGSHRPRGMRGARFG